MDKSIGWVALGVLAAAGAVGLAVLRDGAAGLAEASRDGTIGAGAVACTLAVVLGWRLAASGGCLLCRTAVGGSVGCGAVVTGLWLGPGPIVAVGLFGLLVLLLVATAPRVRAGGVGLGFIGGLVDGEGAVCVEAESERAKAA